MADKSVGELIAATSVTPTDLFVLEQNGTAKKLTGQTLENWLVSFADGHGGIQSVDKIATNGLVDTYRITLADTTTFDFIVNNGRGINSITKTGTAGLVDTYTISFNDNTSSTFTVTNGAKGDKGDNAYIWIKYSSQKPTASSHSFGDVADDWIGIYYGTSATAPTDWQQYEWFQIKGEKGDTGNPATLVSAEVAYQVSESGTIIPSGTWRTTIPVVAQGKYLWTRIVQTFNTGEPVTAYTISRMGLDGLGSVVSVANISPDLAGNVPLTAEHLNALPITGGDMLGSINMQGQQLTGLNEPTEDADAANKGYTDKTARKASSPYNHLHNGDFTRFVAQAGIGGNHGTDAYAGDRWILDSGTVTGEANEGGEGYSNITLNGTIRQIVANPPDVATPDIEMISGTATITYEDGEVTITSSGGVIGFVKLFEGEYTADNMPKGQPRGYAEELLLCQAVYFCASGYTAWTGYKSSTLYGFVTLPVKMRITPSVTASAIEVRGAGEVGNAAAAATISAIGYGTFGNCIRLTLNASNVASYQPVVIVTQGLEVSADL